MQNHITTAGLKLLWHQKWYIIHVWRHCMIHCFMKLPLKIKTHTIN